MKRFDYLLFIPLIFLILFFNYKIDENIAFYADNSTKYFQAYSVIENGFRDDIIRCKWLEEFDFCKYHIVTNTMVSSQYELKGVFPFYLSYINAIFIDFFGSSFFLWYPQIFFIIMIFIIYKLYHNIYIPLILFFCTPLFFFFLTFTDVALNIFFFSFLFVFLSLKDQLKEYQIILLGIITGINIFFRYEGNIFIGIFLLLLLIFDKSNWKKYIFFISGLFITSLFFLMINSLYYGTLLGNRFDVNKESILNWDIQFKLLVIAGNLWGIPIHPVGFFKFMPFFLVFYIAFIFYKNQFSNEEKIIYYATLISLVIIILLAPNDSNVDYGTRYLSVLIIPSIFLLNKSIQIIKSKIYKVIILLLFLVSVHYNYEYAKSIVKINLNGTHLYQSIKEDFRKDTLWIFFNHYWPNMYGLYMFDNKVVVIKTREQSESFIKLLEDKKSLSKYKKILISNLNMNFDNIPEKFYDVFYEDPDVKKNINDYFKKKSMHYDYNKIKYENIFIEFHYFFLK